MTTSVVTIAEDRYRTLLDASIVLADQPTVKAVLHSLRSVLSSSCRLHGAHLWVFDEDGESLRVLEFDREADGPRIKIGTKVSLIGPAARVFEEQKPVFVPNISEEMSKQPELAPFASEAVGLSAYLFPVSTSHKKSGVLAVTKSQGEEFLLDDVELLRSMASHIAVALECALAKDRAEHYQRELAGERDRLRLVLEITNHVTKLDINDVLRSASASIRSYFRGDFADLWLVKEENGQLRKLFQDFPGGKRFLPEAASADLTLRILRDYAGAKHTAGQQRTSTSSLSVFESP